MKISCFVVSAFLAAFGTVGLGQGTPWRLVCFEKDGLTDRLEAVVNAQQFLRNEPLLKSGSCGFAQIPAGSSARYLGIYETSAGFLFPLYRVTYATTSQRMFAADGIFAAKHWHLRTLRGTDITFITPKRCDVLDGYASVSGRIPSYMKAPPVCGRSTTG